MTAHRVVINGQDVKLYLPKGFSCEVEKEDNTLTSIYVMRDVDESTDDVASLLDNNDEVIQQMNVDSTHREHSSDNAMSDLYDQIQKQDMLETNSFGMIGSRPEIEESDGAFESSVDRIMAKEAAYLAEQDGNEDKESDSKENHDDEPVDNENDENENNNQESADSSQVDTFDDDFYDPDAESDEENESEGESPSLKDEQDDAASVQDKNENFMDNVEVEDEDEDDSDNEFAL